MDSPPYLFDQFAKMRGISKEMAKRGLMMQAYADEGRTFAWSVSSLGIAKATAQRLARKLMIDFPDYRPYAEKERKGLPRPAPEPSFVDEALCADVLDFCARSDMAPATFGRLAIGDPSFVIGLRQGRRPRQKVSARVRAFMAEPARAA
jgi:hypothetical protein